LLYDGEETQKTFLGSIMTITTVVIIVLVFAFAVQDVSEQENVLKMVYSDVNDVTLREFDLSND